MFLSSSPRSCTDGGRGGGVLVDVVVCGVFADDGDVVTSPSKSIKFFMSYFTFICVKKFFVYELNKTLFVLVKNGDGDYTRIVIIYYLKNR